MMSEEFKSIVDQLANQGKMHFIDAVSEEEILIFEKEQQIILPNRFKEWLQFSDGGELFLPAGIQLYGIKHTPLLNVNDKSRPSDEYIVIGALASGDPILCGMTDQKISIYNQEAGKIEEDEIYDDFIAFINDLRDLLGVGG